MIEIQIDPEHRHLTVIIGGQLSSDDLERLDDVLSLQEGESSLDVVVELTEIESLPLDEVKRGLEFSRSHSDRIRRMALVMEDSWWRHVARLGGQTLGELLGVEAKDFTDGSDARNWLTAANH